MLFSFYDSNFLPTFNRTMNIIPEEITSPAEFTEKFINQTNQSIFLTGKAGTGKTTLLKKIIASTHKKHDNCSSDWNSGTELLEGSLFIPCSNFLLVDFCQLLDSRHLFLSAFKYKLKILCNVIFE